MAEAESHKMPIRLRLTLLGALLAGLASANSGSSAQPATVDPFPASTSPEVRVARIGFKLASLNLARCPRQAPLTGLAIHDLGAYAAADRPAIRTRFALGEGMGVLFVVPESPAARAGIVAGDEIVALDGVPVAALPLPATTRAASYDRVEAFLDTLAVHLKAGSASLRIRSGSDERVIVLPRRDGCATQFAVVPGEKPDAWSDGRYAVVTQGLARVAGDDELAFALGHEMAHVVLGHAAEPHGALAGIGIGGKRSRDRERAADQLGITMMMAAGYDPRAAETLLARLAATTGPSVSLTHPSFRSRTDALRRTIEASIPASAKEPPQE